MKRLFDMVGGLLAKKTYSYYMEQGTKALEVGNAAEAEREYNKALELAEEAKAHEAIAEISRNLGSICERLEKLVVAETHYRRAFQTHEDSEQFEQSGQCLLLLGKLYHKQRRLPDAEQVLHYAMAVYQQQFGANHPGIAQAARCLADCYIERDAGAEAEKLLQRAIQIDDMRSGEVDPLVALDYHKLALACAAQKKDAEAEAAFKKSAELFARLEPRFDKQTAHQACACLHDFGKFCMQRNNHAQARTQVERAMQLADQFPGYLEEADLAELFAAAAR